MKWYRKWCFADGAQDCFDIETGLFSGMVLQK